MLKEKSGRAKIAFVCAWLLALCRCRGEVRTVARELATAYQNAKKIDKKQLTSGAAWCIIRAYKGHGDPEKMEA